MGQDTIGLEFPSCGEAIKAAEKARIAIMREDAIDDLWLEIVDETGNVIAMIH